MLYTIANVEELDEGVPRIVQIGDTEIGIYKLQGKYFAYENVCAHQGGPACEGAKLYDNMAVEVMDDRRAREVVGENKSNITCPWHGIEYDIKTGTCRADPKMRLRPFNVVVDSGVVKINVYESAEEAYRATDQKVSTFASSDQDYEKVASTSDLASGDLKHIDLSNGVPVVLARIGDDYFAIGAICTHEEWDLSEGKLEGHRLVCAGHGAEWDLLSGTATFIEDLRPEPIFDVKVIGLDILVSKSPKKSSRS
ncbi:MAG: Rieske (2Fe-2S) protein [Nitrososphaerales archaeon]